jgi:hypothetical protein
MLAAILCGGAAAQEILSPDPAPEGVIAADQIDFTDAQTVMRRASVSVRDDGAERFAPAGAVNQEIDGPRRFELELAASGGDGLDVSFAQRASLGAGVDGDIARQGRGSELRIGRGLVEERAPSSVGSTYMFVASDNEALTWQPGQRGEFGNGGSSFSLQDRVEVGDMSVGVTYERSGVQASLAYVEREESTTVGNQSFSQDESFTGLTVTMRR